MKIAIGISSYAFQKFLDRYGEEIITYASERGEEIVREYGPRVVNWTADQGTNVYHKVAPPTTRAASRLSAVIGRPAGSAVIPGPDESETGRLAAILFGRFAPHLATIGAYVRAAAQVGVEQLGGFSDEQIGAIAVSLWRAQNNNSFLGRRLRKAFWKK